MVTGCGLENKPYTYLYFYYFYSYTHTINDTNFKMHEMFKCAIQLPNFIVIIKDAYSDRAEMSKLTVETKKITFNAKNRCFSMNFII